MPQARATLETVFSVGLQGLANLSQMNAALRQAALAGKDTSRAFSTLAWATSHGLRSVSALGKAAVGMTDTYRDFGHTLAHITALMGDAGSVSAHQAKNLTMIMRDVEHAPGELAKALLELNRAGIEGGSAVNKLRLVADLATVSQEGLATSALAVATAYHAWGGPLITTNSLMDKFARASNISTFNLGSLMKAMSMAQGAAINFNQSLSETLTGISMLAPITGPTSKAGTAFQSALKGLASAKTQALYKKMGVRTTEGGEFRPISHIVADVITRLEKEPVEKRADIERQLFDVRGGRYAAAVKRLMERGVVDLNGQFVKGKDAVIAYHDKIDKGKMTLSEMTKTVRDLSPEVKWQVMVSNMKRLLIEWGGTMMGVLEMIRPAIEKILKAFQWFANSGFGKAILLIGSAGAIAGLLALAVKTVGIVFGLIKSTLIAPAAGNFLGGVGALLGGGAGAAGVAGVAATARPGFFQRMAAGPPVIPTFAMALAALEADVPPQTQPLGRRPGWLARRFLAGTGGVTPREVYGGVSSRVSGRVGGGFLGKAVGMAAGVGAGALAVGSGLMSLLGPIGLLAGGLTALYFATTSAADAQEKLEEMKKREVKLIGVAQDLPELFRFMIESTKKGGPFVLNERITEMIKENPFLNTLLLTTQRLAVGAQGSERVPMRTMVGSMAVMLQKLESEVAKRPELMTEEGRRQFFSQTRVGRQEIWRSMLKDQAFMGMIQDLTGVFPKDIGALKGATFMGPKGTHPALGLFGGLFKGPGEIDPAALLDLLRGEKGFLAPGSETAIYPFQEVQLFGTYLSALTNPTGPMVAFSESLSKSGASIADSARVIFEGVQAGLQLSGIGHVMGIVGAYGTPTAINPREPRP